MVFILLRSKAWFFGLLFLLAGLYQVSLVFGMNGDDRENITGKTLKLLSYNTGNADSPDPFASRRHVFEQKAFYRADVICLQEFIPGHARGSESLQRFEYHINVDFTGKTGSRANGLSIYSKFPILEQGFLKPEDEDVYALWVSLDLGTDTLLLINVQLQSIRLEDEEVEVVARPWRVPELFAIAGNVYRKLLRGFERRERQVAVLKGFLQHRAHEVILCGDLNDPPASYTYRNLRKFLGDAFLEQGSGFGFTYAGPLPFLRIDFVMASEGLEVVSFERIGETFSDHFGLEAEFVFHRYAQMIPQMATNFICVNLCTICEHLWIILFCG
ncbi:MAG: endonuclease/exonuclease/phosphatase family protein [Bacteroidales bacterium]|nr:endonuclease/exonuclease/phosphatase family protein [Bacteroidales bacterium]